jgi:RNA polymerase sigma-70 factor (ECF subfamily)
MTPFRRALVDDMSSEPPRTDVGRFAEIVEPHRELLYRVALRLSGNPEIAKDLVQETMLRALRRFDQFQQGTHAATWLSTILTNLFLDQLKHEKVVRKAEPDLVVEEAVEHDATLADIADADLYAAIQSLEPDLRDVVELCYLRQMRYREVAQMLGVPVGTIGTRLLRARTQLRVLLTGTNRKAGKP